MRKAFCTALISGFLFVSCVKERYCVCSNSTLELTAEATTTTKKKAEESCKKIQETYYAPPSDLVCTVKE